jgi:hypothetical protein
MYAQNEVIVVARGLGYETKQTMNESFLFGRFGQQNSPRKTQQPAFSRNDTLGKFGVQGRSRKNVGMASDLQFTFVDTSLSGM